MLCLAFVVVPLILYGWLMFRHVADIKQQETFLELSLFVEDQKIEIEEAISHAQHNLGLAKVMAQQDGGVEQLNILFKEMVKDFPGEMVLLTQNNPALGWVTVASSEPALLEMRPPCEIHTDQEDDALSSCIWQGRELFSMSESLGDTCKLLIFLPIEAVVYHPGQILSSKEYIKIHLYCKGQEVGLAQPHMVQQKAFNISYERLFQLAQGKEHVKIPSDITRIVTQLPIQNTLYEVLVDLPFKVAPVDHRFWRLLSWAIILFAIVGGGIVWWLTHKMARPLKSLARVMQKVESGIYDVRYNDEPLGFEINGLGECFNHMLTTMMSNIEEAERQKLGKRLLSRELAIGHEIQKSLFPKSLPSLPHLDIATMFHPAQSIAGDFYDLFLSQGKILIVMADAAGKGVSACLYSLLLRGMLRSLVESGKTLGETISIAQKLLVIDSGESSMFITAWVGLLDPQSLQLQYASLGHFPAILRRGANVEELDAEGSALGVEHVRQAATKTIKLEAKDLLLLYTDGLAESKGNDRKTILDKVKNLDLALSSAKVLEHLAPPPPYEDDLTLVAIRITS